MWDLGSKFLCRSIPQSTRKFKINCYTYGFWSFENIAMKNVENVRTHIFETLDFGLLKFRELATLKLILKLAKFESSPHSHIAIQPHSYMAT